MTAAPFPIAEALFSKTRRLVLSNVKLQGAFGIAMADWKISLAECMGVIKQ